MDKKRVVEYILDFANSSVSEEYFRIRGNSKFSEMGTLARIDYFWRIMDEIGITKDDLVCMDIQFGESWLKGR